MKIDALDIEELDRFFGSNAGQTYARRVLAIAERHVKACQDRRAAIEDVRASQGAIEVVYAVMALPDMMRAEAKQKGEKPNGK